MKARSRVRSWGAATAALLVMTTACDGSADPTTTPDPVDTTAAPTTTSTSSSGSGNDDGVGLAVPVVRRPAGGEVVYFVLTDRFENGDPSNDTGGHAARSADDVLTHGFLPTDSGYYHGGDLAGLESRLDYLAGLGISAVWITPPFTNRTVQGNGTIAGSSAGYHGYWQVDYTTIDPHLGTDDEMKQFVAAAHDRGIRVYFDSVLNHTGDVITFAEGSVAYRPKDGWPLRDADGEPFDESDFAGGEDFPDLDAATSFPYTPIFATESDSTAKAPFWLNDPVYYHNRGNSTFSGESSFLGDFFGLDDLLTEHPDVVDGMIDIYSSAVETYGIDGFRVDTVKHVNDEFWAEFVPALEDAARAAGDDDFFMFGEVFSSDPLLRSHYTTAGPFPSVLDFGFSNAAVTYAADQGNADVLVDLFEDDDWYTDEDSNASMLVKFMGNHDEGRLGSFVRNGRPRADDVEHLARMGLAMELMFTTRGIPLIYYGDEQGFVGDGGDKGARQDMFPSQVADYNDDDLIGSDATTADSNFDTSHELYQLVATLAQLRRDHPALETGAHINRHADPGPGIYVFSRIDRSEQIEYLVATNNTLEDRTAVVDTATSGAALTAVYPQSAPTIESDTEGTVEVTVPALGTVVYQAEEPIDPSPSAPDITVTNPQPGASVSFTRFRIEAALDRKAFAEVTFAVALNGGDFAVLGTDDAPPYRVFWDRTDVPAGTQVEVMATVDDLSGHRAVALSRFTLE